MAQIKCHAETVGNWVILLLPELASQKLPSRGMLMAEVTIDSYQEIIPLEPDGKGSHWFKLEKSITDKLGISPGTQVKISAFLCEKWPEPNVPKDIQQAIKTDQQVGITWEDITVAARWDWIRWIRSTKSETTRGKRIGVMLDKMKAGDRRPCCFNRSSCTEPQFSKSGVLSLPSN